MRVFLKVPSSPSPLLPGAVSVGQGATAKSQQVPGSEVEGPGCGWCTCAPITHRCGPQTCLEKGTQRGSWGLASETTPV